MNDVGRGRIVFAVRALAVPVGAVLTAGFEPPRALAFLVGHLIGEASCRVLHALGGASSRPGGAAAQRSDGPAARSPGTPTPFNT